MPKPPTSVRSIRLPDDLWADLSAEAGRLDVSVNALVVDAVKRALIREALTSTHEFGGTSQGGAAKFSSGEPSPLGGFTASFQIAQDTHGRRMLLVTEPYTPEAGEKVTVEPLRMPRAPIGSRAKKPGKAKR